MFQETSLSIISRICLNFHEMASEVLMTSTYAGLFFAEHAPGETFAL